MLHDGCMGLFLVQGYLCEKINFTEFLFETFSACRVQKSREINVHVLISMIVDHSFWQKNIKQNFLMLKNMQRFLFESNLFFLNFFDEIVANIQSFISIDRNGIPSSSLQVCNVRDAVFCDMKQFKGNALQGKKIFFFKLLLYYHAKWAKMHLLTVCICNNLDTKLWLSLQNSDFSKWIFFINF